MCHFLNTEASWRCGSWCGLPNKVWDIRNWWTLHHMVIVQSNQHGHLRFCIVWLTWVKHLTLVQNSFSCNPIFEWTGQPIETITCLSIKYYGFLKSLANSFKYWIIWKEFWTKFWCFTHAGHIVQNSVTMLIEPRWPWFWSIRQSRIFHTRCRGRKNGGG